MRARFSISKFILLAIFFLRAFSGTFAFGDSAPAPFAADASADLALHTFLDHFWDGNQNRFLLGFNAGNCVDLPADYWLSAQAFQVVIDHYERTRRNDLWQIIEKFFSYRESKGWLERRPYQFFDDEGWMGLALVHVGRLTKDPKYLNAAKLINEDVQNGWDETCCGPKPGGVWWSGNRTQKSTVSNAVAATLAAQVGLLTKQSADVQFAKKVYEYWFSKMSSVPFQNPEFLKMDDHILGNGDVIGGRLTYNEGMMIEAAVALFQATHDARYLADARKFENYILDQETSVTPLGPVLSDHSPTDIPNCRPLPGFLGGNSLVTLSYHKDFPLFKYAAFRGFVNLEKISSTENKLAIRNFLDVNARAIWEIARDPQSGLFSANWEAREPQTLSGSLVSAMSAAAGSLSLYAELSHAGVKDK